LPDTTFSAIKSDTSRFSSSILFQSLSSTAVLASFRTFFPVRGVECFANRLANQLFLLVVIVKTSLDLDKLLTLWAVQKNNPPFCTDLQPIINGVDWLFCSLCIACYLLSFRIVFAKVRGFSALMRRLIDFRQVRFCHHVRYIIIAIIFCPSFF
jgi:hypothetical protein